MAKRWEGERLEKIRELALYTGRFDKKMFSEKADELFPGESHGYLRTAINNLRIRNIVPAARDSVPQKTEDELTEEEIVETNRQQREIARLKDRLQTVEKLYKNSIGQSAGLERIEDLIKSIVDASEPVQVPKRAKAGKEVEEEEAILLLSDLHIGEVVDEDETGGIAVFNLDIASRRLQYTIDKTIKLIKEHLRGGYVVRKLNVFVLGDIISGEIHKELEITNEVGAIQQILYATDQLEIALQKLAQEFEEVNVVVVVGNHGRKRPDYYFKQKAVENYDYLIGKMLQQRLSKQPNLNIKVPRSYWTIEKVANRRFLMMHGDGIKGWGGIPFYGMNREYLKWRALAESYVGGFDDLLLGHFHIHAVLPMQRDWIITNGTLKGGDEYSMGAISAANDPLQVVFGVSPKRGRTWLYTINSRDIR